MRTRDFLESQRKRRELRVRSAISARLECESATGQREDIFCHSKVNFIERTAYTQRLISERPLWQQNRYDSISQSHANGKCLCPRWDWIGTKARKRNARISLNVPRTRLSNLFDTSDLVIFARNLQLYDWIWTGFFCTRKERFCCRI